MRPKPRSGVAAPLIVLISALFLAGCSERGVQRLEWLEMGTVAALEARGSAALEPGWREACREEYALVTRLLNAWDPDSEMSRLATTNGYEHQVTPAVLPCYQAAFKLMAESGGAFNPLLARQLQSRGFTRRSQLLDLGGIAKGFAVDLAYQRLRGARRPLLIDLGGNLRAVSGDWETGVRDPAGGGVAARFTLKAGFACATSGYYERGRHILDGRTLAVVSNSVRSVTVVAPTAMLADALSTTLLVLGAEAGGEFLRIYHPDCAALLLLEGGEQVPVGDWEWR